jgi:hypothetical protein
MDFGQLDQNAEFLWRRLLDECPLWAVAVPILFALFVVALVAHFRRERRVAGLLWGIGIVAAASCLYLPLALLLRTTFSWLVVLVPVVGVALFYTGAMYFADARSIHPLWAVFLGLLRCGVYAILAVVFLLPGIQLYEQTVTHPKVLFLFDASGSMQVVDDLPEVGQDPVKLPSRQDKVVRFLTDDKSKEPGAFMERVLQKSPVTAYRFGSILDESQIHNLQEGKSLAPAAWSKWLKPDMADIALPAGLDDAQRGELRAKLSDQIESLLTGTNVSAAALQMMKLENSSYLQAVVVVSDGQSNLGSDEAFKEFLARVNNPKRPVPVYTIGVGQYIQPAGIRIDDLQVPEITRPDDKFPVRVPVVGTGLTDEEFTVQLDVTRVKDGAGEPLKGEKTFTLGPKTGKFKGAGDNPQDTVEFEIDVQELKNIKVDNDPAGELEGTWQIVARVPRHAREPFPKAEHVTEPVDVVVQKKKLRVLLFAGGATREYQFVRALFYREVLEKRVDLSIYLQTGNEDHVDQDVEKDRLLSNFPDRLGEDDGKHSSLDEYDVIIAFDPDWTALTPEQHRLLEKWVGEHSGGIIFVAGPVFSYHLARPAGRDMKALLSIFPVVLQDSRLHGLGLPNVGGHDTSHPYALHFTAAAKQYDFLKLDEAGASPTAGWNGFFWGTDTAPEPGKDIRPRQGIHNYYPVERLRPDSAVLATFAGPKESRINEGRDEQPYLVSMRYGSGKTLYVGSGELWRLRKYRTGYHDRLWIKMARYVAAGATQQKKYGRILLGRSASTGTINLEAQLRGANHLPLSIDTHPTVYVKRLDKGAEVEGIKPLVFDLRAKPSDAEWQGWFNGSVRLKDPGEYEFRIPVGSTGESLTHRLSVRKPNPELDNVRTNFDLLYSISSESAPVLARLDPAARKDVERALQREGKGGSRLFFSLGSADAISRCLTTLPPKTESVKGPLIDLWDRGVSSGYEAEVFGLCLGIPLVIGLLGAGILLFLKQPWAAAAFFGLGAVLALGAVGIGAMNDNYDWGRLPVDLSFVLIAAVALLAVEWLTRKLLRLA